MSIVAESQSLAKTTPPVTIVNSEELDSRNDGAKPIDNRRAIEDDVTKFSSIDYNLQHSVETIYLNDLENGDNKQGVSKNNLELHEYENPPKPYKTKRQKKSIAVHDNADVVQNEVFDKDNLGLEELFKEEAVPIVANEQLPEEEHHADKHLVVNVQPLETVPQAPANVVHVENHPPAVQPLEAVPQPPANVVHVENHPPAVQPLAAAPQPPANVVHVENHPPAVQPLEAVPQPPANVVHVENHPPAVQPLAAAPQPPANVVHVENHH
ncbi:hypothetical protein [Candidatus Tisiphia endosymbiont of Dascillus cervinus]|uniref:hypothetical protein n=1 Tax=Candidatus Tisiphia endosymbiont of Dascillus cervinus TaxID=3066253 RepID=UPI00312CA698